MDKAIIKNYKTHSIVRFHFKNEIESNAFVALLEMFGYSIKEHNKTSVEVKAKVK